MLIPNLSLSENQLVMFLWRRCDVILPPWCAAILECRCVLTVAYLVSHRRPDLTLKHFPHTCHLCARSHPDQLLRRRRTSRVEPGVRHLLQEALLEESPHLSLCSGASVAVSTHTFCHELRKTLREFQRERERSFHPCGALQGEYVVAGCAEGALHMWQWTSFTEVSHIPAHCQRIHHCSVLSSKGNCTQASTLLYTAHPPLLRPPQ